MDIESGAPPPPVPVPTVPADALSNTTRPRRRSSLPTATDILRSKKRSPPNYVRQQPASPEVISSLIDSLSAISLPAQNHFENLPTVAGAHSTPASPNVHQSTFIGDPLTVNGDNSMDYIAYRNALRENELFADDAAEPPVIRTSKPPSGYSPLTAPKKEKKDKDSQHSLKSLLRAGHESMTSLHSTKSLRSVGSIGNISIEARAPRPSNERKTSSDSKRSGKGHRSLMYMSSREKMRTKENERKRATVQVPDVTTPSSVLNGQTQYFAETPIDEEPVVAESSRAAERYRNRGKSPLRNGSGVSDSTGDDIDGPSGRGLIPERGSSLRHSDSPSRRSKRSHHRRGSKHDASKTKTVPEEDENPKVETPPEDKLLRQLEADQTKVAQRIKELRAAKELKEKIAGKLPVGVDAGAALSASHVSPIPSDDSSPTSSVSSLSQKRPKDPTAKAHKVLGIVSPSNPAQRMSRVPSLSEVREAPGTHKEHRHSRTRSRTINDGEDTTPLPIDYPLALQTLNRVPSDPASSKASTKGTVRSTTSTRSKSFAVGGRSAVGRTTNSMIMGTSTVPSLPFNVSKMGNEHRDNRDRGMLRAASEEITPRHRSMISPSSTSPASLPPRPALKKKRWSHPDLPLKAEQAHNEKVDNAVKPPPQPVIEERPTSMDSIDNDVEAFLDSPRLSQRVRHPQTGRVISFSEVGDPKGFAIFCCVGMGLTRYVTAFYDQLASTLKLRLITLDRPGIGDSQLDPNGTPLSWPDDVLVVCQYLKISKFSLLAHSAGAVYALATALRMPQHIRGRVHLLAPWIPPSQMAPIGVHQDSPPGGHLPRSQRFLRVLPPSLLKVANSAFLSATSASMTRNKTPQKNKRKSVAPTPSPQPPVRPTMKDHRRESMMKMDQVLPNSSALSLALANPMDPNHERAKHLKDAMTMAEKERQHAFDERLTFAIWDRATMNANPATDLIVCLETKQSIGFRYEDITRGVVIHHGSKDSRVPVDNVRWLGRLMRRCEVRILDGEQHGLMASALVMGNVLTEIAKEWEDWTAVVNGKGRNGERSVSSRRRDGDSTRAIRV